MDLKGYIEDISSRAKSASFTLRSLCSDVKNQALIGIANEIEKMREEIKNKNRIDYENGVKKGLSKAFLDRLLLNDKRIDGMIKSLHEIAGFEDPVGEVVGVKRPQGFTLEKVRVPIGVIAVIFESRPNVTIDAAALCLKSGNAVILRGGSDAIESGKILSAAIKKGLKGAGIDEDVVQYVERTEHEGVSLLVKQDRYIDLVIPRGGENLIRRVVEESTIPVIKHYKGVCHIFVDESADFKMALDIIENAKVQRPGVCNALETLLVHDKIAEKFLPLVQKRLSKVELRGCEKTRKILKEIKNATEEDYYTEYLDLILSVKIVDSVEDAILHIEKYGSHHTDGIISESISNIEKFVNAVDSAVVTVNSSTRLSDGGVFGLGAEIGISTDKLHARGPMGLRELTTYKWVVRGNGDLRIL